MGLSWYERRRRQGQIAAAGMAGVGLFVLSLGIAAPLAPGTRAPELALRPLEVRSADPTTVTTAPPPAPGEIAPGIRVVVEGVSGETAVVTWIVGSEVAETATVTLPFEMVRDRSATASSILVEATGPVSCRTESLGAATLTIDAADGLGLVRCDVEFTDR